MALLLAATLLLSSPTLGKGVYQTVPEFLTEIFAPEKPQQDYLWLTPELKASASEIVNHPVRGLRIRYWRSDVKTVWVMEEIGKELPITIGVVVNQNIIEKIKILAFRESRGWEVRYAAFTAQYQGAKITPDNKLDSHIDGITGATLSIRAVTKVAILALHYHQQVFQSESKQARNKQTQDKESNQLVTKTP
ncbi:MAG: hypothetical protein ACI89Z_000933 [Porticoccus sp.]